MAVREITANKTFLLKKLLGSVINTGIRTVSSKLAAEKDLEIADSTYTRAEYSHNLALQYPEFLPNPKVEWRNIIREKLERDDMLKRRKNISIPEFYVGSILAVTTSDKHAIGKTNRFVGICIQKDGYGLRTWFTLRNVVEHQGVEIKYDLYSPVIQRIEVLRLEKRPDKELLYLRDAPHEYSTFPMDMEAEYHAPDAPVRINMIKVPLNSRPWGARHERKGYKGATVPPVTEKMQRQAIERAKPWEKYDLVDEYRRTIPEEEQREIFGQIKNTLRELELKGRTMKRKRVITKLELPKTA